MAAVIAVAWAALTVPQQAVAAEDPAADQEQPLIAVLTSDASKADKAITCKKLAVWGTAKAVPALAALLPDDELTSWARIALEAIPDPAADRALRDALIQVEGRTLVGVVSSLGVRRDAQAVDALAKLLNDTDTGVASAAAFSLGQIGDAAATKSLEQALAGTTGKVRSAVAEGCVLCAQRLLAAGSADQAAQLYDKVRQADVPRQRIVEAMRGAIVARGAAGVPLLVEQLKSDDRRMVAVGLSTARQLQGDGVTRALVAAMGELAPERQALLTLALADRGDAQATPAMLAAAQSGPAPVRIAAIDVLKKLGDKTCVPALLEIAAGADDDVAQAAVSTLEVLPGDGVNEALAARLADTDGPLRAVLIQLVGRRRIDAVPPLLTAVDDTDPEVRSAALTALGEVVGLDHVAVLIERAIAPQHAEDAETAQRALRAACVRMPDREACAAKVAAALAQASSPAKVTLLETLAAMGGTQALQTIGAAAVDANPELQDTATRLLGSWMTVDAGPVLLRLAQDPKCQYQVRALRGYLRLPRQMTMTDEERVAMCRNALRVAERDDERKLVFEIAERFPSIDMFRLMVELSKTPSLKNDATQVSLLIAQKIGGSADAAKLLQQLGQEPVKVEIVKAEYGVGSTFKDVTQTLRRYVRDLPLIVLPSTSYNSAFGGDPAPGIVKQLKIEYRMEGKAGEAVFPEDATIMLPMPK